MNVQKALLSLFAAMTLLATAVRAADRPNVVIIYGDDVGYGDVGVYGARLIPTPNIDKLASEGLVFTDGHCSAATCTPSRFSMLTGIHGFRHGVRVLPPNAPLKIKPDMFTLPQLFKKAGYATAVIGKWHLGLGDGKTPVDWNGDVKPGPLEVGFDYSFLLPSTNDRVPCVYLENHRVVDLDPDDPLFVGKKPAGIDCTEYPDGRRDRSAMTYYPSSHGHNSSVINGIGRIGYQWGGRSALWDDETMADEFVRQTKKYLALRTKERPFFLYFSSQDIHVPRAPHPRFRGKSKLTYRGDAMVQLDWATGEILKSLDEHGLAENTLVIFSSDNGPVYDDGYEDGTTVHTSSQEVDRGHDGSGPYRGGKYQIYEGGTRVPLIVKWPGRIEPGISNALVNQIDFIASFANLLHIELGDNQAIDSRNMMPAILGKDDKGLPYTLEEARGQALRRRHWKYVRGKGKKTGALYNLETDIGEQNNVVQENAAVARQMKELLQKVIDAKRGIRQLDAANDPEHAQRRDHLGRKLTAESIDSHDSNVAVAGYASRTIEEWAVRVSDELLKNNARTTHGALERLAAQLRTVSDVLPERALAEVKTVPIWLSPEYAGVRPTGEYHPGADWLRKNGRHAALHRCIEFTNTSIFAREIKRMPMMVLHELAHAYHDQVLGFDHPQIRAAYEKAVASGKYAAVLRGNGKTERAYAMTNDREYFAESTEAFFGTNDFYPFNQTQLKKHDPVMYDLLSRLWHVDNAEAQDKQPTSYRATPAQRPRPVLDRIKYHSLAEGRQLISDESWEPYISAATDDMLRFSIGLKVDAPIPTDAKARTAFACRKYADKVLEFTGEEQAMLRRLVTRLNELTGAAWPCVARLPWHFIKVDSSFCNGMAHTRGLALVLSERYLRRIASDERFGMKLLLHEKLHVVQRLNGPRFASLYEAYGFQKVRLADGELQRFNVAQNPDAVQLDWAIQLGETPAMLLTLLVPGKNGNFSFQTELRTLCSRCDGSFTIGPVRTEDEEFHKWRDSFPLRVGHDHPNEVSAYLSGVLLERDFLLIENEPLNEVYTKRVDQTRSALRQVLRIDGE